MKHDPNIQAGVTLIELMITIVILAIIVTIALPNMANTLDNRRLAGAAQSVYEHAQFARTEAIKQSRNMLFVAQIDSDDWCVGVTDDPSGCDCFESDSTGADACTVIAAIVSGVAQRELRRATNEGFCNVSMTIADNATVNFNFVRGTADGISNITVATPKGNERTLSVTVTGRVSLN